MKISKKPASTHLVANAGEAKNTRATKIVRKDSPGSLKRPAGLSQKESKARKTLRRPAAAQDTGPRQLVGAPSDTKHPSIAQPYAEKGGHLSSHLVMLTLVDKFEVSYCIGMAAPLAMARLLLACRRSFVKWAFLREKFASCACQGGFRHALDRCLQFWKNRGSYIEPTGIMQNLGVAIAHGADADLVFALLAGTNFHYPLVAGDDDDIENDSEGFCDSCPFPFTGPFGSPLYAASTRNDAVCLLLLRCGANPFGDHYVRGYWGDGDIDAWEAETPLHAAVRKGRTSTVGLLLSHGSGESLARYLQEPGYLEYSQGLAVHPDGGHEDQWQNVLYMAIHKGDASIVKTLLDKRADPEAVCWHSHCSCGSDSDDIEEDLSSGEFLERDGRRPMWLTKRKRPLQVAAKLRPSYNRQWITNLLRRQ